MPGTGWSAERAWPGGHRFVVAVACAAVVACLACVGAAADVRTEAPAGAPEIVVLEGAPGEIGRDHGRRLGERIRLLEERYLGALLGGDLGRAVAVTVAAGFRERLRPHHRAELDAMAEAAGLDPGRALLANSFLDLLPSVGCSTVTLPAAAAPDGVARFGRNLDFPALGVADGQSLVVVVKPADRHAFAAVTWPGLVGVLSGINEHGLALANMEVSRPPRAPAAMPYALLYRTVLEECRTVDEALALLDREARQTANNLMLMDASGARALVEITPGGTVVRRAGDDEPLVATNHHRSGRDEPARCRRYDGIVGDAARNWGKLDLDAVRGILDRAGQGELTLQSMILEPRNLVLHLAVGREATTRDYRRIDLGAWLKK